MARRNVLRSWAAASLLVLSGSGALLAAAVTPAGADNNRVVVYVTDNGYSDTNVTARVGDQLIFVLGSPANNRHTVTWDGGQVEDELGPNRQWVAYPMNNPGTAHFYDRYNVAGPNGQAFAGTLTVTKPGPPPPDTTSSSTSTTVTTVPPTSTTTVTRVPVSSTTTLPPTTATTGLTTIRPMLVSDSPPPAPTTTTTTAPKKNPPADKGKGKAASPETPTTAAPAPPTPPGLEPVFDPSTLTPAPLPQPDSAASGVVGPAENLNLDPEAVASLLKSDKPADDGTPMMLAAMVGLGLFLVVGAVWRWHHRASRYFPA